MLEELGWESVVKPLNGPTGLCIPMDLNDLVYVCDGHRQTKRSLLTANLHNLQTPLWPPPELPLPESLQLGTPTSHVDRDALLCLANLSNHILATKASKQLAKLKSRHRSHFSSPSLYYRALDMLSSHHYRQPVRKYIVELFDLDLSLENSRRINQAGAELRSRKLEQDLNGPSTPSQPQANGMIGLKTPKWAASGVSGMMNGGVGGIEGEITEDDDQSSVDEGEMTKIPLKVLTPLLTVRGFLLS